jgi:endonuclease/exonuclease/phosphatase family metal-dependent hydrolase
MIRVASYNMRKAIGTDRRRRPERTIEVLNELDADVIALQEADRRFGSKASAIPVALLEAHSDYKPVEIDNRIGSTQWPTSLRLAHNDMRMPKPAIRVTMEVPP